MALRDARGRLVIGGGDPNPVVSIAITTEPTNTQYAGNPLDLTGLVITATRRDGTTQAVTLVEPETLTIKTPATKTAYTDGEDVDTTGLVLTVTYSDDSTKDITSGFVVSPTVVATGDTEITVSYTEGEVTVNTGYAITVGD